MLDLRAITLVRPMSAAIVHGTKRIENRPMDLPKAMRGRETIVAVHAGKGWDGDYCRTVRAIDGGIGKDQRQGVRVLDGTPYEAYMEDTGIVGLMRLTGRVFTEAPITAMGIVHDEYDRWYYGPFGYEIADAAAFPEPIPCRGMLGFWRVPADVIAQMRAQVDRGVDARLADMFYQATGEVWPCPSCRSRQLCESGCVLAPWNQGRS